MDDFDLTEIFADYFTNEGYEDPLNAYTGSMATHNGAVASVQQQQQQLAAAAGGAAYAQAGVTFHPSVGVNGSSAAAVQPLLAPSGTGGAAGIHPAKKARVAASGGISLPVGVGIQLGGVGGIAPASALHNGGAVLAASGGVPHQQSGIMGMMMSSPAVQGNDAQSMKERRQKNREHAKRSRVRKKFMLESLQEQVLSLQKENERLRTIVQDNIPQSAQKIIADCCSSSPLFSDDSEAMPGSGMKKPPTPTALVRSDFSLMECLASGQQNFVLSDPRLPDNPIVFATPGFYKLTGYTQEQVLGRNCRFLQGPGTNPKTVDIIRKARPV